LADSGIGLDVQAYVVKELLTEQKMSVAAYVRIDTGMLNMELYPASGPMTQTPAQA